MLLNGENHTWTARATSGGFSLLHIIYDIIILLLFFAHGRPAVAPATFNPVAGNDRKIFINSGDSGDYGTGGGPRFDGFFWTITYDIILYTYTHTLSKQTGRILRSGAREHRFDREIWKVYYYLSVRYLRTIISRIVSKKRVCTLPFIKTIITTILSWRVPTVRFGIIHHRVDDIDRCTLCFRIGQSDRAYCNNNYVI